MSARASEWECLDIIFGFPEVRELRAGVLDSDAEHVFTSGHCHSFAEALRRLTACRLVFAFDGPDEGREEVGVQGHVFVRIAGRDLDARGWVDERLEGPEPDRLFEAQWDRVREIGPEGWLANSRGWLEPRVDDALPFAAALLQRLQVPIDADAHCDRPSSVAGIHQPARGASAPVRAPDKEVHLERDPNRSAAQPAGYAGAGGTRARPRGR